MIDHDTIAAALKTAEVNMATIEARAVSLAGTPSEFDVQLIAEHARRITNNLRQLLNIAERRTT